MKTVVEKHGWVWLEDFLAWVFSSCWVSVGESTLVACLGVVCLLEAMLSLLDRVGYKKDTPNNKTDLNPGKIISLGTRKTCILESSNSKSFSGGLGVMPGQKRSSASI